MGGVTVTVLVLSVALAFLIGGITGVLGVFTFMTWVQNQEGPGNDDQC